MLSAYPARDLDIKPIDSLGGWMVASQICLNVTA